MREKCAQLDAEAKALQREILALVTPEERPAYQNRIHNAGMHRHGAIPMLLSMGEKAYTDEIAALQGILAQLRSRRESKARAMDESRMDF